MCWALLCLAEFSWRWQLQIPCKSKHLAHKASETISILCMSGCDHACFNSLSNRLSHRKTALALNKVHVFNQKAASVIIDCLRAGFLHETVIFGFSYVRSLLNFRWLKIFFLVHVKMCTISFMQVTALSKNMGGSHVLEERCTLNAMLASQCVCAYNRTLWQLANHADRRLSVTVFWRVRPTITMGNGGCSPSVNETFMHDLLVKCEQCNMDREGGEDNLWKHKEK